MILDRHLHTIEYKKSVYMYNSSAFIKIHIWFESELGGGVIF
jgi:hypothetical protein